MADPGDLHALAQMFLNAAVAALDSVNAYDATLLGAQDRRFISPGTPLLDCCDQLAIHVNFVGEADTSPAGLAAGKRPLTGSIPLVTFHVTSTRCVPQPTGTPGVDYRAPSAAALQESARQLDADAWALWNYLFWLQASDQLLNLCDEVFFDGITPIPPSGGCAGWLAQIRAYLGGYRVSFST